MLLKLLKKIGRYECISDKYTGIVYMKRIYPLFKGDLKLLNFKIKPMFNVLVHNITESEGDDMHDHPWDFLSIILYGGYFETTPKGRKWYGPGSIIYRKADTPHRIEVHSKGVWTLFIHGKEKREWGFIKDNNWLHYTKYPQSRLRVGK
jgi:hypothetical protein